MAYVSWPSMMMNDNENAEVFLARGLFESAQDLDCRFYGIQRPYTVTDVLTRCLKQSTNDPYTNEQIWQWTLPQRLQGLLAIVIASGQATINTLGTCHVCSEITELELDLHSFIDNRSEKMLLVEPEPGVRLKVEIPNGYHQLEWMGLDNNQLDEDNELDMATSLTQSVNDKPLPVDWCMPRHWLDHVQTALEECDPFTAFSITVDCPNCSETMTLEPDLEELLLRKLESSHKAVLEEVYYLARAYHWTEVEIFNLPVWRRRYYMQCYQHEDRI